MLMRIAAAMGCAPADDDDLVEAVRLLVAERDEAKADRARLRAYLRDATDDAAGLVERVHRAVQTHQGVVRERDAARTMADGLRVSLADADLILEERERQLTAALTAVAEEREMRRIACRGERGWPATADDYARALAAAILEGVRRACASERARADAAEVECARLRATDAAARIYLAAVDARDAAEAAWANAKSGRYAAQENALVCRGAMRDARTALVKSLDIQPIVK